MVFNTISLVSFSVSSSTSFLLFVACLQTVRLIRMHMKDPGDEKGREEGRGGE